MNSATKTAQLRLDRVTPSYCRVVLDNPPLNLMGPEFVLQIREIVTALENDDRVGEREHQAPRERSQPAARRRNQGGMGRLHGLRQATSGAGKYQSPPGARAPEARRRARSTRVLPGTAGPRGRALKIRTTCLTFGRKHTTMDLLTIAKNIADR